MVSYYWASLWKCKASYCSKNNENHQTAVTFSVLSRSGPLWFPFVWPLQRISEWNKVFKWWSSKEYHKQTAKNSDQRFLGLRNTEVYFLIGKMCVKKKKNKNKKKIKKKEIILKNKADIFFQCERSQYIAKFTLFIEWFSYWIEQAI